MWRSLCTEQGCYCYTALHWLFTESLCIRFFQEEGQVGSLAGNTTSGFATVDHHLHRLHRAPLNPFFSKKSITALAMDIITDFAFGAGARTHHLDAPDFGLLWKENLVSQSANGVVLRQFPWLWPVLVRMPLWLLRLLRHPGAGLVVWQQMTRARIDEIVARNNKHDGYSGGGGGKKKKKKAGEGSIFQSVLDSDLPPGEKTADRLQAEAQIVIGAGTETTAKSLSMISFYLNHDPAKRQRLREELATVGPEPDGSFSLAKLEKLPYLTACITEGVRMMSGVTGRLPRVAHEPLQCRECQMNYVVNNDPTLFPQPLEFRPERWLVDDEAEAGVKREDGRRLERYMVSFMRGSRACIGVNLAWAELYLALAYVVARFDLPPYDTTVERDLLIDRDLFVGVPKRESKGIRAKVVCCC
ncbi:Cytochrome P450 monooxygenase sdnE [Apiospora phragmitis]|uniref:Cytochrome P450 monooxygenase sdnE n=1 Tax=Apiospora phragmitis TaxID=2905665 RepID=A0ABR1VZ52_9PEZI